MPPMYSALRPDIPQPRNSSCECDRMDRGVTSPTSPSNLDQTDLAAFVEICWLMIEPVNVRNMSPREVSTDSSRDVITPARTGSVRDNLAFASSQYSGTAPGSGMGECGASWFKTTASVRLA